MSGPLPDGPIHEEITTATASGSHQVAVKVSTTFDVPSSAETGQTRVVVVANGLESASSTVTIQ